MLLWPFSSCPRSGASAASAGEFEGRDGHRLDVGQQHRGNRHDVARCSRPTLGSSADCAEISFFRWMSPAILMLLVMAVAPMSYCTYFTRSDRSCVKPPRRSKSVGLPPHLRISACLVPSPWAGPITASPVLADSAPHPSRKRVSSPREVVVGWPKPRESNRFLHISLGRVVPWFG